MINLSKMSVARISSGLTALVCAGFLIHAIMTDNGGQPDSQERWQEAQKKAHSLVERMRANDPDDWYSTPAPADRTTTASIIKREMNQIRPITDSEPSVMSLIRENADVNPGVSPAGTARVSVLVKKGDTLFGIARRHGLTVTELARLNGLEEPYVIRIGQTLYVAR